MAIQSILLLVNKTKKTAIAVARDIMAYCKANHLECHYHDSMESSPPMGNYGLAISLGGDGTALWAGRCVYGFGIPVLALNSGKLGFLTCFKASEWQMALQLAFDDKLMLSKRTLLQVSVERGNKVIEQNIAINEIIVASNGNRRIVSLNLLIDNDNVGDIYADGLIVASATGSTAYALSCGGPIMPPESQSLVVVPISPFSLSMRPLSLPQNHKLTISVKEGQRTGIVLALDGTEDKILQENDKIILTAAPHPFLLLWPQDLSFYQVLQQKLGWKGLPEEGDF